MKKYHRLARIVLAATAAQLAVSTIAAAATCASPVEKAALDTRVLQSELMVAALTCGQNANYNAFVEKFQPVLVTFGQTMRSYFTRAYGKGGEHEMDAFVTRTANSAATRRMQFEMTQYCASANNLFSSVLAVESKALPEFAGQTPFAAISGVESCPAQAARDPSSN